MAIIIKKGDKITILINSRSLFADCKNYEVVVRGLADNPFSENVKQLFVNSLKSEKFCVDVLIT